MVFCSLAKTSRTQKKTKKTKKSDPWARSGLSTHKPKNQKNKKPRNQKTKKPKKTRLHTPRGGGQMQSVGSCLFVFFVFFGFLVFCFFGFLFFCFLFFWFFGFLVFCFFGFLVCVWIAQTLPMGLNFLFFFVFLRFWPNCKKPWEKKKFRPMSPARPLPRPCPWV